MREAGTISIAANLSPSFNFIALTPLVARFLALNCKAHHQNHLYKTKKNSSSSKQPALQYFSVCSNKN
jgi:hypothetical protein